MKTVKKPAKTIAIAGNPNVGKSTLFNSLTGMRQHTGNWAGKTVTNAKGYCVTTHFDCTLMDIPGTYSLLPHSDEEVVARNYLCFGGCDAILVVCDAACLERNLNLVLQIQELNSNVILCVNFMDEAEKKGISIDFVGLSRELDTPVVGICARRQKDLRLLLTELDNLLLHPISPAACTPPIHYDTALEETLISLETVIREQLPVLPFSSRFLALQILDGDESFFTALHTALPHLELPLPTDYSDLYIQDKMVNALMKRAKIIHDTHVTYRDGNLRRKDFFWDRILTSPLTGYPVMLLLLALIFWLTISGANYPSSLLSKGLFALQDILYDGISLLGIRGFWRDLLILGGFRTLAWVVSVMLPPMMIFFPLFTLLEDVGYLPRIAYNLDSCFQKCKACGKQALTMSMGFGCNAAGITGCRIIDSPRERLLAILTNNFVPCNGRYPALITLITLLFAQTIGMSGTSVSLFYSLLPAVFLTGCILLGVFMTFCISGVLSRTILKGVASSFTLELPPYRRPQVGRILIRSILDRTFFVLGRAVIVALPAGMVIFLLANTQLGGTSLLARCAGFLDPFARLMGLDGSILFAFILGLPANEIVLPIIIMIYTSQGMLVEPDSLNSIHTLFLANGWTQTTAICTLLFVLMHWPCSTTLLTIQKETGSLKWTFIAFLLPTFFGILCCMLVNLLSTFLL